MNRSNLINHVNKYLLKLQICNLFVAVQWIWPFVFARLVYALAGFARACIVAPDAGTRIKSNIITTQRGTTALLLQIKCPNTNAKSITDHSWHYFDCILSCMQVPPHFANTMSLRSVFYVNIIQFKQNMKH